jgi:hypothetical protein
MTCGFSICYTFPVEKKRNDLRNEFEGDRLETPEYILLQFSNHLTLLPVPLEIAPSAGLAKESIDVKIVS